MRLKKDSAERLQRILSKRFNRALTEEELENAYSSLMSFAFGLISLLPEESEFKKYSGERSIKKAKNDHKSSNILEV